MDNEVLDAVRAGYLILKISQNVLKTCLSSFTGGVESAAKVFKVGQSLGGFKPLLRKLIELCRVSTDCWEVLSWQGIAWFNWVKATACEFGEDLEVELFLRLIICLQESGELVQYCDSLCRWIGGRVTVLINQSLNLLVERVTFQGRKEVDLVLEAL